MSHPDKTPRRLRLLLAEDEAAHAALIRRAFADSQPAVEIEAVGTLQAYRAAVAAAPPDLALVDMNLPDGRAVEILSTPPESGPFPILVMTSYGNEQVAVEAIKAGALDYLVKSAETLATTPQFVRRALREWSLRQDRQRAEAACRESEERYRMLVEHANEAIYVVQDGCIRFANAKFLKMANLPAAAVVGQSILNFLAAEDHATSQAHHERLLSGESLSAVDDVQALLPSGGRVWVSVSSVRIQWDGAPATLNFATDISARKAAEAGQERLVAELRAALADVRALSGLLPICAGCKKIRDDRGYWNQVETYLQQHTNATFTHGLCPECIRSYFPEEDIAAIPAPGNVSRLAGQPAVILLVEDDPAHAEMLRRNLAGFRLANPLHHVADGQAALDYLQRQGEFKDPAHSPRPDLILLDLNLPKIDGLQVLSAIKTNPDLSTIPVVVLTTSSADSDLRRASENQAAYYLTKPLEWPALVRMLESLDFCSLVWNRRPFA